MALAELLREKIEKQIDRWSKELDAAESKARAKQAKAESDKADAELEKEILGKISDLRDKIGEGRRYLEELLEGDDDKAEKLRKKYADLDD